MDLEEVVWVYTPIFIAIFGIIFSFRLTLSRKNLNNGIITFLITLLNGFSIYVLFLMLNDYWPTYLPHLFIILAVILFLIQNILNKRIGK